MIRSSLLLQVELEEEEKVNKKNFKDTNFVISLVLSEFSIPRLHSVIGTSLGTQ